MNYQNLGKTDLRAARLCLGTMQFGWSADEPTSFAVLDAYTETGGNFIDTADIYSQWIPGNPGGVSEEIIGRWMQERGNRDNLIIATKGRGRMWSGPDGEGLSRAHLTRAVEDSLRRLQIDHIDLYQTHWDDMTVPIEETLQTLNDLVQAGKLRAIGCSNYSAQRLQASLTTSEQQNLARYETLQPQYSLVHRRDFEGATQQTCVEQQVSVIPYSPLAGGFLTGKYRRNSAMPSSVRSSSVQQRYFNARGWRVLDAVEQVARDVGATMTQVSLAWLMAQPAVAAPITGANSVEQLREQVGAVDVVLTEAHIALLNEASHA